MKKWLKRVGGVGIFIGLFLGTLYLLLATFVRKPKNSHELRKEYTFIDLGDESVYEQFYVSPGARFKVKLTRGDDVVYDQLYEHDQFMFRIPRKLNTLAKKHIIFGGCSFTWGEGLKSEETLPAFFQELLSNVQAYNHSFPGGGLHSLLRYHDFINLREAVKEEEGVFFYTFIPTHIERFFARYSFLHMAPAYAPYYQVENGEVIYKGFMKDQKVYQVFQEAKNKNLGDTLINTQDPIKWDPRQLKSYILAVRKLKFLYNMRFPRGKFIFLFHPIGNPPTFTAELISYLREAKIDYINLAHEFGLELMKENLKYPDMVIPGDGHPKVKANQLGARALWSYLKTADRSWR